MTTRIILVTTKSRRHLAECDHITIPVRPCHHINRNGHIPAHAISRTHTYANFLSAPVPSTQEDHQ